MNILDSIVAFILKPLDWYYSARWNTVRIWDSIFKPDVSKLEADSDIDGLTAALKYFTGDLSDDNPGTKAVLALGRMGDAAVEPLTRALYSRNLGVNDISDLSPLSNLTNLADHLDPLYDRTIHIRIGATVALGKTRHPLAVGPLIRALAHPDFTVGGAESPGIGKRSMITFFGDRRNLTKRAIDALGEIGDAKALPHLERFARGIPGITEPTLTELRMCAYKAIARIEGNGNWDLTMEVFPDGDKPPRVLLGGNQVLIDSERSPYPVMIEGQQPNKRKGDYLEEALAEYLDRVTKSAESERQRQMWHAEALGAYTLLEQLRSFPGFDRVPDDMNKAKRLLELGIQAMISRWYWNWERQESHSEQDRLQARLISLQNVQTFLGINSEESIRVYLGFDKEFQLVMTRPGPSDSRRSLPFSYIEMLCRRHRECTSGEVIVDWQRVEFPIATYQELVKAFRPVKDLDQIDDSYQRQHQRYLAIWGTILSAGGIMFDEFRKMSAAEAPASQLASLSGRVTKSDNADICPELVGPLAMRIVETPESDDPDICQDDMRYYFD
jgi:hypothetical protein